MPKPDNLDRGATQRNLLRADKLEEFATWARRHPDYQEMPLTKHKHNCLHLRKIELGGDGINLLFYKRTRTGKNYITIPAEGMELVKEWFRELGRTYR